MHWYQVVFQRRTGWVLKEQIRRIIEQPKKSYHRLDASRLSERERDKSRLFLRYDKERLTRKFEEAL